MVVRRSFVDPDLLVENIVANGLNVVGPLDTAQKALAHIARTPADLALISPELADGHDGRELARRLEETWGVRAVMLPVG